MGIERAPDDGLALVNVFSNEMERRRAHPNAIYNALVALVASMVMGLGDKFSMDQFVADVMRDSGKQN